MDEKQKKNVRANHNGIKIKCVFINDTQLLTDLLRINTNLI